MSNVDIKFIHDNYYVVDLKASAVSSNSVTMSWKKPNGYDAIDHYIIYKTVQSMMKRQIRPTPTSTSRAVKSMFTVLLLLTKRASSQRKNSQSNSCLHFRKEHYPPEQ